MINLEAKRTVKPTGTWKLIAIECGHFYQNIMIFYFYIDESQKNRLFESIKKQSDRTDVITWVITMRVTEKKHFGTGV